MHKEVKLIASFSKGFSHVGAGKKKHFQGNLFYRFLDLLQKNQLYCIFKEVIHVTHLEIYLAHSKSSINTNYLTIHYCLLLVLLLMLQIRRVPLFCLPPLPLRPHSSAHSPMLAAMLAYWLFLKGISHPSNPEPLHMLILLRGSVLPQISSPLAPPSVFVQMLPSWEGYP